MLAITLTMKKTDFVCAEPLVRGWSKNATISENGTGEATIHRQIFFALEYVAGTNTKLNKLKIQFYQHEQGAGKNAQHSRWGESLQIEC